MMNALQWVGTVTLFCPWIIWGLIFLIAKNVRRLRGRAFRLAADVTTLPLIVSIDVTIRHFFQLNSTIIIWMIIVVLLMVMTIIEWRINTDLYIGKIIKKLWRFLFIAATICYIGMYIIILIIQFV